MSRNNNPTKLDQIMIELGVPAPLHEGGKGRIKDLVLEFIGGDDTCDDPEARMIHEANRYRNVFRNQLRKKVDEL